MKKPYVFWYSQQHADWFKRLNEDGVFGDCHKNYVTLTIDGEKVEIPYTACIDATSEKAFVEPYTRALTIFPDYVPLGIADLYESIRTPLEVW